MQVSRTCGDRNKSRDKYIVHSRHVSDKWGGEWPFNKDGSWKIFVEFQGSLSLFFFFKRLCTALAVSIFSQRCLGVAIFC